MPHKCPHCDLVTRRNSNLLRHIERKHSSGDKLPTEDCICSVCQKSFSNVFCRDRHYYTKCYGTDRELYSFNYQKILPVENNINIDLQPVPFDERLFVLARKLVSDYFQMSATKNIYTVKGKCYVFNEEGWTTVDEEATVTKFTKYFILSTCAKLQCKQTYSPELNQVIEKWISVYDNNFNVYSESFMSILQLIKTEITNYSLKRFPNGHFKKMKYKIKVNSNQLVEVYRKRKREAEKNKLFGFAGKIDGWLDNIPLPEL